MADNEQLHKEATRLLKDYEQIESKITGYNEQRTLKSAALGKVLCEGCDALDRGEQIVGCVNRKEWYAKLDIQRRWAEKLVERHRNPDKKKDAPSGRIVDLDKLVGKLVKKGDHLYTVTEVVIGKNIDEDSSFELIVEPYEEESTEPEPQTVAPTQRQPKKFNITDWLKRKHPDVLARYEAAGLYFDDPHDPVAVWLPLAEKPCKGWSSMSCNEKHKYGQSTGCEYCLAKSSARSCPLHGWAEKRHDHDPFRAPKTLVAKPITIKLTAPQRREVDKIKVAPFCDEIEDNGALMYKDTDSYQEMGKQLVEALEQRMADLTAEHVEKGRTQNTTLHARLLDFNNTDSAAMAAKKEDAAYRGAVKACQGAIRKIVYGDLDSDGEDGRDLQKWYEKHSDEQWEAHLDELDAKAGLHPAAKALVATVDGADVPQVCDGDDEAA